MKYSIIKFKVLDTLSLYRYHLTTLMEFVLQEIMTKNSRKSGTYTIPDTQTFLVVEHGYLILT